MKINLICLELFIECLFIEIIHRNAEENQHLINRATITNSNQHPASPLNLNQTETQANKKYPKSYFTQNTQLHS